MGLYSLYENEGVDFHFVVENFLHQLVQHWPDITINPVPSRTILLDWNRTDTYDASMDFLPRLFFGSIYKPTAKILLIGDDEMCVDFALWYRSITPTSITIWVEQEYKTTVSERTEITSTMTMHELVAALIPKITHLEEAILQVLLNYGGEVQTHYLNNEVMTIIPISKDDVHSSISKALISLWSKELVSSPGTKWLTLKSPSEYGKVFDYSAQPYDLTLTDRGFLLMQSRIDTR